MQRKLYHYTDRALVSSLPDDLKKQMHNQYLITHDDIKISFCGLVINSSGAHVFLPRNSNIPKLDGSESYQIASFLMKAIRRYSEDRTSKLYALDGGIDCIGSHRLNLISTLLEDFCNNGLYSRRLSEKVLNTGKPDWKRTISNQTPFPGKGGPVYLDVYGTRRRYFSDSEVSRIHASIIKQIDKSFGWIVTGSNLSVSQDIQNIPLPKGNITEQLRVLHSELISVFSERDIRLLQLLSEYLECNHGREISDSVIGLKHFHGMWEHMLDKTLSWNFPVNRLLSVPTYQFNDGTLKPAASKAQRTDTVLRYPNSNKFAVVDAKYYGAQGLNSAPGWPDLVKQFFYAKALKVYCPESKVSNAFVFPGSGPLKSVHMQNRTTKNLEDDDYPPIKCLYLDPIKLINHYVKGKKLEEFSRDILFND